MPQMYFVYLSVIKQFKNSFILHSLKDLKTNICYVTPKTNHEKRRNINGLIRLKMIPADEIVF